MTNKRFVVFKRELRWRTNPLSRFPSRRVTLYQFVFVELDLKFPTGPDVRTSDRPIVNPISFRISIADNRQPVESFEQRGAEADRFPIGWENASRDREGWEGRYKTSSIVPYRQWSRSVLTASPLRNYPPFELF